MNIYENEDDFSLMDINRQQMSIVTQLLQTVPTMYHIDELFQWLAYVIVQRFNVQTVQFWTNHANAIGQISIQLRTMINQDVSLPEQVVANDRVELTAQRIANERRSYKPFPVDVMFSHYQAALLRRYGLNYCVGSFINANVLLPPRGTTYPSDNSPTLFAMTTLLFLQQTPHPNLASAIGVILEQAVSIASNRGLLLPPTTGMPQPTTPFITNARQSFVPQSPPIQQETPSLRELIPRRKQDADLLLSSNPFASNAVISDKKARRFYAAIDEHSNVDTLCESIGMELKEAYDALEKLLAQRRIELYEPNGQRVNPSRISRNS